MSAVLGVPLLAQENPVEMPALASRAQPSPASGGENGGGAPDFGNPRFVFHRVDGAFLRLDLVTGAVASCGQNRVDWTCVPGREERAALDHEIARLRRDNAVLKNTLLQHGVSLPGDMSADLLPGAIVPPALPSAAGGEGKGAGEAVPRPPQTVPPAASVSPPSAKSGERDHASRDDAELERAMVVMERVWRRLIEMMIGIQRDLQKKG